MSTGCIIQHGRPKVGGPFTTGRDNELLQCHGGADSWMMLTCYIIARNHWPSLCTLLCPHRLLWLCNRFVRMSSIHIFCCASSLLWHSQNPDFAVIFKLCRNNLILWVFKETFLALCLYLHINMQHWFWYFLHILSLSVAPASTFVYVCVFEGMEDGEREGGGGVFMCVDSTFAIQLYNKS